MKEENSVARQNGIAKSTRGLKIRLNLILVWATVLAVVIFLFSIFSTKIFTTIDELYFYRDKDDHVESSASKFSPTGEEAGKVIEKTGTKEYTFSEEQIEQAKKEILEKNEKPPIADTVAATADRAKSWVQSVGKKEEKVKILYSIEMLSGGFITCYNIVIEGKKIIFEDEKGLVVAINRDEIKTMKRLVAGE